MTADVNQLAARVKLLLMDVDGVLTDGKLFFFPAPAGAELTTRDHAAKHGGQGGFGLASSSTVEAKGFHAHDGTAISLARLGGIKTGLITKRISETVALRARDLKLEHVHKGIQDKLGTFREILKQENLKAAEACFVGDDVIAANPGPASDFKAGKAAALNFLKGQVMKLSKGKANPALAGEILERKLRA